MRAAWQECALGDLARIKHGYAFKGEFFGSTGTHVVLTPGNFREAGGFKEKPDKAKWYSGPVPDEYVLNAGDLIVAMTEQSEGLLGSSALVPRSGFYLHNQRLGLVTPAHSSAADRSFLYYLFNSRPVRQQIRASANGAKIRHTSPTRIYEVKVRVPDIAAQRRIASILSAYDELIENNTRRIAILEEMAQRIYEEWFVRFRFPGHEDVPMVESELGLVPEGWQVRLLGDEIELAYGKALKAEDRTLGDVPVYGSSGVVGYHSVPLVGGPGVIVGRKGNVGSVHWCDMPFFAIDTVFYVKTALPLHYVFFNLQRQNFLNNDAAVPGLNRNQAYALPLLVPSPDVLSGFEAQSTQILGLGRLLARKNANLRSTRDLLLPKLISGELDVSAIPAPEALTA